MRQWARELVGAGDFEDDQGAMWSLFQALERSICAHLWAGVDVPLEMVRQWGAYMKALGGSPEASSILALVDDREWKGLVFPDESDA